MESFFIDYVIEQRKELFSRRINTASFAHVKLQQFFYLVLVILLIFVGVPLDDILKERHDYFAA